jgi:hypothetical protein
MIKENKKVESIESEITLLEIGKKEAFKRLKAAQRDVVLICENCGHEQKASDTELAQIHRHSKGKWIFAGTFFHCNKCCKYEKNKLAGCTGEWPDYPKIDSFKRYEFAFGNGVIIHEREETTGCYLNFAFFKNGVFKET